MSVFFKLHVKNGVNELDGVLGQVPGAHV
jgi:hypothetical protein